MGHGLYDEFCAGFPYDETDDQRSAIDVVLDDLASGRPMDRLVCGDVGFGKTEVALRAAFIAAMNGKQVAVVVPTTLLAPTTVTLRPSTGMFSYSRSFETPYGVHGGNTVLPMTRPPTFRSGSCACMRMSWDVKG